MKITNQDEKLQIGQNIRSIREEKGATLSGVAEMADRTPQWLSNIEKGRRAIKTDDLYKLAHILDVEIGIFFRPDYNNSFNNETGMKVCNRKVGEN